MAAEVEQVEQVEQAELSVSAQLADYDDATIHQLWTNVAAPREDLVYRLYEEIQKINPPTPAELNRVLSESEDPDVVAYRTKIAAQRAELEQAEEEARAFIASGYGAGATEDELKAKRTEFATARKEMLDIIQLVRLSAETLHLDDVVALLKAYEVPSLRGTSPRTPGQRAGEGAPRPRLSEVVVQKAGQEARTFTGKDAKMSKVALFVKSATADVLAAWLAAADVTEWQAVKGTVSFEMGAYTLSITPALDAAKSEDTSEDE